MTSWELIGQILSLYFNCELLHFIASVLKTPTKSGLWSVRVLWEPGERTGYNPDQRLKTSRVEMSTNKIKLNLNFSPKKNMIT